jgi:hypothetical protein
LLLRNCSSISKLASHEEFTTPLPIPIPLLAFKVVDAVKRMRGRWTHVVLPLFPLCRTKTVSLLFFFCSSSSSLVT